MPRGRSGITKNRDQDLRQRVKKLEELISKIDSGNHVTTESAISRSDEKSSHHDLGSGVWSREVHPQDFVNYDLKRFVAGDSWAALSEEVDGIRNILGEASDEIAEAPKASLIEGEDQQENHASALLNPHILATDTQSFAITSCSVPKEMLSLHFERVDSIIRILHQPSLHDAMYSQRDPALATRQSPDFATLCCAVQFVAYYAQLEDEFSRTWHQTKKQLVGNHRLMTENWLSRIDIFNTRNLVALQAFVVYLVSLSCFQSILCPLRRISQSVGQS